MLDREINVLEYLPNVIREFKEFQSLAIVQNPEIKELWSIVENVMSDQFLNDSTENGVKRWEDILRIVPKGTDSIDLRKFRILARLNEQLPYTILTLEQQLFNLCGKDGYEVELRNKEYILKVKVSLVAKGKLNEVDELLKRVVPANMIIDLTLMYNQHSTLKKFTHGQMKIFTHKQLRNEVLT